MPTSVMLQRIFFLSHTLSTGVKFIELTFFLMLILILSRFLCENRSYFKAFFSRRQPQCWLKYIRRLNTQLLRYFVTWYRVFIMNNIKWWVFMYRLWVFEWIECGLMQMRYCGLVLIEYYKFNLLNIEGEFIKVE